MGDDGPMRLDHIAYAAGPEGLASCVQRLGSHLGAGFQDGGLHPSFGTRNFVLPLRDRCYVEVVEALDHPAVDQAPFGRAVRARSAAGGGWLAWVVEVDDMSAVEQRLGRAAAAGHRRRPDGFDLHWQQIGITNVEADPQLPFFIHWDSDAAHHPAAGSADSPVRLSGIEIAGDQHRVDNYLGTSVSQPLDGIAVSWVAPGSDPDAELGTGLVAATFQTAGGPVRID